MIGSTINTAALTQSQTTDYVGNVIYENNALKRILVDGGYIESGTYYFYQTDHLGNNRIVANQGGTAIQKNHYYPFGTAFADKYDNGTNQPYKYNSKELDQMHGLNMYDYSARYYESAIGRFTTVDPLAEMYYSWSPYAYCINNPMRITDPTGMDWVVVSHDGNELRRVEAKGADQYYKVNETAYNNIGSYSGVAGGFGNGASENGNYSVGNYQDRSPQGWYNPGMNRDGVGFSYNLNLQFSTGRTALRIHPDGNNEGTLGCIGLSGNNQQLNSFVKNVNNSLLNRRSIPLNINIQNNPNKNGRNQTRIPNIRE